MEINNTNSEFYKTEYTEIGVNLRHLNDIRSRTYQYATTMSGILIVGLTTILSINHEISIGLIIFLTLISLFGMLVATSAYFIESRSVKHFSILVKRAIALENESGVAGQMTLSNSNLEGKKSQISNYMKALYVGSILFWFIAPLSIYLVKS
ncbi:hypothetical protein [Thalassomonas actiniarum]|uniref:Uncharacterized protein n=1 Tax=Thalassomonas actiniarum TaxID=485447 RepID=A0AAE9YVA5_9GAMM|nr:hypothetical protein [Thalassomonas actiniarum]WDE00999.1 hypothetical protein SG35_010405 [Thalassomonas actiniarum]